MTSYDVAVAYRIYPKVSKVPPVHKENKYDLAKLCLESFKNSLGSVKVKLFVLLDNCPPEYEELFKDYFDEEDLNLIKLDGIGNLGTFSLQIKILLEQECSNLVYFAEDDYFYLPNQFEHMINFLKENKNQDVHFVTPYDHLDFYTLDLHKHQVEIRCSNDKHWKTANSTCLTFLTTKLVLKETENTFNSYTIGNYDASLWLSLTKDNLFNALVIYRYYLKDRFFFELIRNSWFFNWQQILFGKRWKLWSPIPSIATHMDSNYLAPTVDWFTSMDKVKS